MRHLVIVSVLVAAAALASKPAKIELSTLPGCCIGADGACVPRAPIFPGGCPEGWTVITDPALCPVPCGVVPTPTPTPPAQAFTVLPGAGAAWGNYVESGGWVRLDDGSWLVTGETGWLAWPMPPDKPGETLCGVHYPVSGNPRRIEYARATDAQRDGDRGHEAAYLKVRRVGGKWVGVYAATWESTIGQAPRVGAGLVVLDNGPTAPATAVVHDWHRPADGVFPAGLVRLGGQWWLYGWDIGVPGQGLARWPVSDGLVVGMKQTCTAGPFDTADVAREGSQVVLWKGDPASAQPVIASAAVVGGRWRDWAASPPPELAWVQSVTNPRVRKWVSSDGCTFTPSGATRQTNGYTSWAPAALTDPEGAVLDPEAVLVTQSPGGAGATSGQWRLAAWHGAAPGSWGQAPVDPVPTPTPTPTRTVEWLHLFASYPSQVYVMVDCSTCTVAWGAEAEAVAGKWTVRRNFHDRPPDLVIRGGLDRVTVIQSPHGTSKYGASVTVWSR